ncbi:type II toxin-antitoxin system RelE/ParE family toxin [Rhizobium sp. RAF56]|uniref:type II toxin-antitoxin system RelE/ParE family toxin n=1 Tax=Rhizobium sp. RAF56 TaxID=3233062 RepID=UPI003F96BB7C
MFKIYRTKHFIDWLSQLNDRRAAARIASRLLRVEAGNLGDVKPVGEAVSEIRIDYGQGYRVYFIRHGQMVIVLLCGGDKSKQQKDIAMAKRLAREWKELQS